MSHSITVRLPPELATWLRDASVKTALLRERSSASSWKSQGKQRRSLVHETGRRRARATKPVEQKGLLAALKGIADTGFFVAFANRTDRYYE